MTRWAPMLLVAFLLAGTAVAFAVTQGLKQERSPVYGVRFTRVFGPHRPATLVFRLRKRDTITLTIVNGDGKAVRVYRAQRYPRGTVTKHWGGRAASGLLPDGPYRLHVHLKRSDATIEIPTVFRLDSTPPSLAHVSVAPHVLTRGGRVVIRYATDEPGQVILRVDGRRAVVTRKRVRARPFTWDGTVGGQPVAVGVHVLRLRAVDLVGNRSEPSRALRVRVREAAP
jgi:hypothetical protein